MDTKSVLTHLIRAGRDAIHMEKTLNDIGYKETPYFNLYGEITDAVYAMLGEDTDSISESVAYSAMHDIYTSDEQCAEQLSSMIDADLNIPDATMDVLRASASERNMDVSQLIQLILSDWARKELVFQAAFK